TGDSAKMSVLASHASDEVRHSLAYCLGRRDEPIARETLIVLSRDRDPEVRDWATFGLGSLSDVDSDDIRAALIARLEDSNPDVRGEALMGLALRRDSRTVHAILRELRRPDCTDFAIEAAAELQSEQLVQHLQKLLQASPQSQRVRAALDACRDSETA